MESLENQENQFHLTEFELECPGCSKLFLVETRNVLSGRPRFSCTRCRQEFWIAFPEALAQKPAVGILITPESSNNALHKKANAVELNCQKCGQIYFAGEPECKKCGVVFAKVGSRRNLTIEPTAHVAVQRLWDEVLKNYEDESRHWLFLNRAVSERNSDFAAFKYGQILAAAPAEEIAIKMSAELTKQLSHDFQQHQHSGLRMKRRRFPFVWLAYLLCGVLFVTGWLVPELRNLAGIGAALLFVIVAIRISFLPANQ